MNTVFFKAIFLHAFTFQEHLFKETPFSGCFHLLQYRGFTKVENTTLHTIPHFYLFPGGNTYLIVHKYQGSSYFPVNDYWAVFFSGEYLLNGYTGHYVANSITYLLTLQGNQGALALNSRLQVGNFILILWKF